MNPAISMLQSAASTVASSAKNLACKAGGVVGAYGAYSVAVVHNATILTAAGNAVGLAPGLLPFIAPTAIPIIGTVAFAGGYFAGNQATSMAIDGTTYVAGKVAEGTQYVASSVYEAVSDRLYPKQDEQPEIEMAPLIDLGEKQE